MRHSLVLLLLTIAAPVFAQTYPSKPLPPKGIAVPDEDRQALTAGLKDLEAAIEAARAAKTRQDLLPDVLVFHKAIDWALRFNEFHDAKEFARARQQLNLAIERARAIAQGKAPWTESTGLVPLGYKSTVDDSIQPYGLVIPKSWSPNAPGKWRLDVWFHGRGETLSELAFLNQRLTSPGEFTAPDTIVAHLYGRYCNANKFAGETDLFESLADIQKRYAIDPNRIVIRGFSMGGAAAWHVAAHHAGLWAAAAPGAGFSETEEFLKITPDQKAAIPPWALKLWNWYDATVYAANFFNLPLVAYSGEKDRQIQAALAMERYLKAEGLDMTHIIGPNTEHKYHPDSKPEINRRIDALAARGRVEVPRKLRFVTYTLRYNRMKWLTVDSLDQHWTRARVDAEIVDPAGITLKAENVSALTLDFGPAQAPFALDTRPSVTINGQRIDTTKPPQTDGSWRVSFHRDSTGNRWLAGPAPIAATTTKTHGLQGPIDDAFLSRFLFVKPTGTPANPALHAWAAKEMDRAATEWRNIFRGEVRIKNDTDITPDDIAQSNLILWGDAGSNQLLAKFANRLPLQPSKDQALLLIYPNPLNPNRYIVLNSGFTFREEANLSNARQIPMLPDWALIDINTPPDNRYPGKVIDAGFFDESWKPVRH